MNDNAERKGAEVREAQMGCPDGEIRTAFIVTPFPLGDARELTVFAGFDCLSRAAEYARARYGAAHFVMKAEPGHIGTHGNSITGTVAGRA